MANEAHNIEPNDPEFRDDSAEARILPLLPVRDTVLFPHAVLPLTVGRESSVQLINSLGEDKTIIVVAQREARVDSPQPSDLYSIGSLAVVHKVVKMPNQSLFVFAEGLERVRVKEYTQLQPFMRATVETVPEAFPPKSSELEALQRNVLTLFQQIVTGSPTLSDELSTVAMNIEEPGDPRNPRRADPARQNQPAPGEGAGGSAAAQQDPERSAGPRAADAARVLPARAAESDPERTGRAGRQHA
jgi:ATP-dependent Lon protease